MANTHILPFHHEHAQAGRRDTAAVIRAQSNERLDLFDREVIEGIRRENEAFLPDGSYYDSLSEAILRQYSDVDTLFDIGVTIGADINKTTHSVKGRIVRYLNTAANLDRLKIGLTGGNADTATTNGIMEFIRLAVVADLPVKDSTSKVFKAIGDTLDKAKIVDNDSGYTWLINKLHFLEASYVTRSNAVLLSYEYNIFEEYDSQEITAQSNVLTREAMRHRKYGTKPAYIDASIGGSWVFYDGHDYVTAIGKGSSNRIVKKRHSNVAAVVYHTEARNLRSVRLEVNYDQDGMGRIEGGLKDASPNLMLYIGKDGSIATDPDGIQDINLVLSDRPLQAAALRAEVASNFYDLSMPLSKVRTKSASTGTLKRPEQPSFDPVQELLIPRIRYIENGQIDEDLAGTDVVQSVRMHDVTWFVRLLPNGWKASPDARALAAEYGIVLAQNETFVKAHTRGQGNKVLAHHAIRRRSAPGSH